MSISSAARHNSIICSKYDTENVRFGTVNQKFPSRGAQTYERLLTVDFFFALKTHSYRTFTFGRVFFFKFITRTFLPVYSVPIT